MSAMKTLGLALLLIAINVISRCIPHVPNVTAMAAVALLAIRWMPHRSLAYLIPLISMLISDFLLGGFHETTFFVYLGLTAIIFFNEKRIQQFSTNFSIKNLGLSWLSASLIFFVISNLGVWLMGGLYPLTLQGLLQCFALAIPFYWTQMAGDFLYIFSLFGIFEAVRNQLQTKQAIFSE
jgi:hypothetical protein